MSITTAQAQPVAIIRAQKIPAFISLLFGSALIFTVGFMPTAEVHNAAHDTRHAVAFPCH